jgi:hypothetical protein
MLTRSTPRTRRSARRNARARNGRAILGPSSLENREFVADFARYSEGILEEKFLRRKYRFDNDVWERLGSDEALIERIEDERLRRQRSGESKREIAQKHIVKAPAILDSIMSDPSANDRHRVDAIRTLDALSTPRGRQRQHWGFANLLFLMQQLGANLTNVSH